MVKCAGVGLPAPVPTARRAADVRPPDAEPAALDSSANMPFFALGAMGLAAIGLYALIAFAVEQRRHEIGVRMALGATHGTVLTLVLGDTSRLLVGGAAIGVAVTALASRLLAPFLFGITVTDPMTLAFAPAILVIVALGASAAPAIRAARINPATALRND